MVKYGQVKRGELGIMGTELNSELAKAMKVDAQRGAFVSQVMPGSAAAKAGIKAGDVITTLNGKAISASPRCVLRSALCLSAAKLSLACSATANRSPLPSNCSRDNQTQVDSSTIFNGIEGAEMSNKGQDKGVVVNNVKAGTPAAQIGLKKAISLSGRISSR